MRRSACTRILMISMISFVFLFNHSSGAAEKKPDLKGDNLEKPVIQHKESGRKGPEKPAPDKGKAGVLKGPGRRLDEGLPEAQVVNNSGRDIYQVKVGNVLFSSNLRHCSDGCSTGFKRVRAGRNSISVKLAPSSPWVVVGTLDGFENNRHYGVNLVAGRRDHQGCAELFLRHRTHSTFNDDHTKERIDRVCEIFPDSAETRPPSAQVVNNSGGNLHQVKVGEVLFSRHIDSCTDGCSTGFKKVREGRNRISVKSTPISPWVDIGSLGDFKNNRHYAVNIVAGSREGEGCAELFLRQQTRSRFNDDRTKERVQRVCGRPGSP